MEKPLVVFLLESISQPRCIKRINSFIDHGYDVEIFGIDRGKYNENATVSGKKINIIDKQADGKNFIKKFKKNTTQIKKILIQFDPNNAIFYCFGFALTLSLKLNGCKNYIYEISDILYGYKKFDYIRWLFKWIDRYLIKQSILTVLTSEGFAKFLFQKDYPKNIIIQPNKLNILFSEKERLQPKYYTENKLKFAYVGAFRYPNTVFRFSKIIGKKYPNHEFLFYGDSHLTNEVKKIAEQYDNVKYFGSFKNPDDLFKIYENIDIVVACYDIQSLNERIAEPNKLYEALYFKKPIIVSTNTFLSERVQEFKCGFSINALTDESIISFIETLSTENIRKIIQSIDLINIEEIIDDNSLRIISHISKNFNVKKTALI